MLSLREGPGEEVSLTRVDDEAPESAPFCQHFSLRDTCEVACRGCGHICSEHAPGDPATQYGPPAGGCNVAGCQCQAFDPQDDRRHFMDAPG